MGTRRHNSGHANLIPAKKGEVRNPKGGKKGITMKSLLTKLLNNQTTIEINGRKVKKTRREVLALRLLRDALDSRNTSSERTKANEVIQNRVEGKPVQPLSAMADTEVNLTIVGRENEL